MLKIELLAVGHKPPAWVDEAVDAYARRMKNCRFSIRDIQPANRRKPQRIEAYQAEEADNLLAAVADGARVIALDRTGRGWSTEELSSNIGNWTHDTSHLQLMIGGPDGLDRRCLERADHAWSLSKLTFPHQLVRVIVAEQVYRALSIIANHPYHK